MVLLKRAIISAITLSLVFYAIQPTFSQENKAALEQEKKATPTLERGIGQYKHENYEEALITLEKARQEDPESSLAAYYLGLTYKQLQDYNEAIPHLKDAIIYTPKIEGALIELIDCCYQLNRLEDAKRWIEEAESEGIRPAQVAFMKGLLLTKMDRDDEAISSFRAAKEMDAAMTQASNYQIGMVHLKGKNMKDAKQAFTEVVIADPTSNMANFANEYKRVLARREEEMRPFKATAAFSWQYDDNVILMPDDQSLVSNISDKGDSREVTTTSLEYNHMFNEWLGFRALYTFYWANQNRLSFYNTVTNGFIGQPTIYLDKALITFPSGFTYTMVDGRPYLGTASTSGIYNFNVGTSNMGQVFMRYQYNNYNWTPNSYYDTRSGSNLSGGAAWYLFYANNKGFLNLRYSLEENFAGGNNWQFVGNRVSATLLAPVTDKLSATVSGDAYFQNYPKSNTSYNICRNDQIYTVSALVGYKIFKNCEVQLQYTYVKDNSNITVYKYGRNIYSVGVEAKF